MLVSVNFLIYFKNKTTPEIKKIFLPYKEYSKLFDITFFFCKNKKIRKLTVEAINNNFIGINTHGVDYLLYADGLENLYKYKFYSHVKSLKKRIFLLQQESLFLKNELNLFMGNVESK